MSLRTSALFLTLFTVSLNTFGFETVRDIPYKPATGKSGLGDLYLPDGWDAETPVVLCIHGGGWSGGDRYSCSGIAQFFCDRLGFAAFNIEYRTTNLVAWPACGDDCIDAARFLLSNEFAKKYRLRPSRLWVTGGSAGGHLALWTGLSLPSRQVAGIVSVSGIGVLAPDEKAHPDRYTALFHAKKVTQEMLAAASPASLLRPDSPRILNTHATVDGAVPFAVAEAFQAACKAKGVTSELYSYEKRDDGHSIWRPGSDPHRLYEDLEKTIEKFVHNDAETAFKGVAMEERPWCYWWWLNGHVDNETITADLEAIKRIGFGGVLMFDARGYWDDDQHVHMPKPMIEFMGPEWRGFVKFAIQEANRLGLRFTMNLSSCGGALKGPWLVGADSPKRLVVQSFTLKGGSSNELALPRPADRQFFRDIGTFAVKYAGASLPGNAAWCNAGDGTYTMSATSGKRTDGQNGIVFRKAEQFVEVTDKIKDGKLIWDTPEGQWILLRYGYTTIDGHEYDVDVLDAKAVAGHFKRMGETILADIGPLAGKTLTHFYSVSWEGAVPTWTGTFEEDFAKYRGYAIRPLMPMLSGFYLKDESDEQRFFEDFRRTRNDLFRDHFYGTMRDLCHARGLQLYTESGGPWVRKPEIFKEADQLEFLNVNDLPQGEFWYSSPSWHSGRAHLRGAASTAHIYGKPLAAAESFTHMTLHWSAYPAVLKPTSDDAFCQGINQIVWHTFTCSPKKFGQPGGEYFAGTHINRNVTWHAYASPFISYLSRCESLLRRGLYQADLAVYMGDQSYIHWGTFSTNAYSQSSLDIPRGYSHDVINADVLLHRAQVKDGRLVLPDGMTYRMLAIDPEFPEISLVSLRRIAELKKAGLPIAVGKRRPTRARGLLPQDDAAVRQLTAELWQEPKTIAETLAALHLQPDVEGPIEFCHRRENGADYYFVRADSATAEGKAQRLVFRVAGRQPEIWDAVTGEIHDCADWNPTADGRTAVTLAFPKNGSAFLVFRRKPETEAVPATKPRHALNVEGPWQVAFSPAFGYASGWETMWNKLEDWSKSSDQRIRHFAGTAVYKTSFVWHPDAQRTWINLGEAVAVAAVRVNGQACGSAWTAPWRVEITGALKDGANELEITVVNCWENRLIGDAALPPEQQFTKSCLQLRKGPRGKNFTVYSGYAAEDPLQPSGLFGPVRIE